MEEWDGLTRVVVQDQWPRGGVCRDSQEMGNIWFLRARVLLDVSACEETPSAFLWRLAGIEDDGAIESERVLPGRVKSRALAACGETQVSSGFARSHILAAREGSVLLRDTEKPGLLRPAEKSRFLRAS